MSEEVSIPIQQRSIDKKNRIKEAGFAVFCENGYYNTNTKEIAQRAGVSTGILYRYYADKKSILMDVMDGYFNRFSDDLNSILCEIDNVDELRGLIDRIVDYIVSLHDSSTSLHEELASLAHYDDEVEKYLYRVQENMVNTIVRRMDELGMNTDSPHEKLHIIINLFESYCHEVAYHRHDGEDYARLRSLIVDTTLFLLRSE